MLWHVLLKMNYVYHNIGSVLSSVSKEGERNQNSFKLMMVNNTDLHPIGYRRQKGAWSHMHSILRRHVLLHTEEHGHVYIVFGRHVLLQTERAWSRIHLFLKLNYVNNNIDNILSSVSKEWVKYNLSIFYLMMANN